MVGTPFPEKAILLIARDCGTLILRTGPERSRSAWNRLGENPCIRGHAGIWAKRRTAESPAGQCPFSHPFGLQA